MGRACSASRKARTWNGDEVDSPLGARVRSLVFEGLCSGIQGFTSIWLRGQGLVFKAQHLELRV
jgi:hypothetical protein